MASGEPQNPPRAEGLTRRQLLTRTAAAGAAAWVAPQIISTPAAAAATCGFSPILLAGGGASTAGSTGSFVTTRGSTWWNANANGGANWTLLVNDNTPPPGGGAPPSSFVPTLLAGGGDASGANSAFVATNGTGTWYRSANGGANWTAIPSLGGFLATLLAGFGNVGGGSGDADFVTYGPLSGWRFSRDAGATWASPATIPIPATGGSFAPTLLAGGGDYQAADPRYGDFVAVEPTRATVSERVWYSINSGNTWAQSSAANMNLPAITWRLLAGGDDINGSFVLYGEDAGGNSPTWRYSTDGGANWQIPGTNPNALPGLSSFRPTLLAGSGDNDGTGPTGGDFVATDGQGVWVRSTNWGNTWTRPTTPPPVGFRPTLLAGVGDGGTTGTPPVSVNDFVAYGACQWYRSGDGGNTWSLVPAANAPR